MSPSTDVTDSITRPQRQIRRSYSGLAQVSQCPPVTLCKSGPHTYRTRMILHGRDTNTQHIAHSSFPLRPTRIWDPASPCNHNHETTNGFPAATATVGTNSSQTLGRPTPINSRHNFVRSPMHRRASSSLPHSYRFQTRSESNASPRHPSPHSTSRTESGPGKSHLQQPSRPVRACLASSCSHPLSRFL